MTHHSVHIPFRLKLLCVMLAGFAGLQSQTLSSLEYWFDLDSDGRRTLELAGDSCSISADISTDGLTDGLHWLYMRAVCADTTYSGIYASPFLKFGSSGGNRVEYWFDGDISALRSIGANVSDSTANMSLCLDIDGIPYGFHELSYRILGPGGNMTPVHTARFLNNGPGSPDMIEFWIDDSIEYSRLSAVSKSYGSTETVQADLDLSYLPIGLHRLNYRLCSPVRTVASSVGTAFVMVDYGNEPIMEFWTDDDSLTIGTLPVIQYGQSLVADGLLDLNNAGTGYHRLFYRMSSVDGRFRSNLGVSPVFVTSVPDFCQYKDSTDIVKGEYWIDEQPVESIDGFESDSLIDIVKMISLPGLSDGQHVLSMRFMDSNGRWTGIDRTVFTKTRIDNLENIDGILYRYSIGKDSLFAVVAGYDDNISKADISSTVRIMGHDLDVISIEDNAFLECSVIDSIAHIPSSVTSIGDRAFAETPLKEINVKSATAPAFGHEVFPRGVNLRVPVGARGYDTLSWLAQGNGVMLTFDESCIHDSQWNALQRIDSLILEHGGYTGWDFTDRTSTPTGISRWGTDHVMEIDLSNRGINGSFESGELVGGLPKISRIRLDGNSITDMQGKDNYPLLELGNQKYDCQADIVIDRSVTGTLAEPAIPLLFRDANTGLIGNRSDGHVMYSLNTVTPDDSLVDGHQQAFAFILNAGPDGRIELSVDSRNSTNVYSGKSGQYLSVTGSGIQTVTPGSHFLARLLFMDGDINLDGTVDISDLQGLIDYIFGRSNVRMTFAWNAANLATDDRINVQDLVGLVGLILDQTAGNVQNVISRAPTIIETPDSIQADVELAFCGGELTLSCNAGVAALDVILESDADFTALSQMGFAICRRQTADGRVHVIAYSLDGYTVPAGEHVIARNMGRNAILSAKSVDLGANFLKTAVTGNGIANGIDRTESRGTSDPYDTGGRKVNGEYNGIIIINGNKILNGHYQ